MELASRRDACFAQTKDALQHALTPDQLVIQAHDMLQDLHRTTNTLAKRLREWAGGHLPEIDTIPDHEHVVTLLTQDKKEILKALQRTESIGTPLDKKDVEEIKRAARLIKELYAEKERLLTYLETSMHEFMPSTQALCGTSIAAELLASAGSLKRLARLPSGTIQLLGAETALFRHLKNKRNKPPKHGIIFNHQLLQRAKRQDRGKVARALADKIALCARIDYFKGEPAGDAYRKALEKRFS